MNTHTLEKLVVKVSRASIHNIDALGLYYKGWESIERALSDV